MLINLLLERPDEDVNYLNWPENTALTELEYRPGQGGYQVVRLNEYTHLQELKTQGYETWGLFADRKYLAEPCGS